jgi:hypothetical protein
LGLPEVSATLVQPPCLNAWGSNAKVQQPGCGHGASIWGGGELCT